MSCFSFSFFCLLCSFSSFLFEFWVLLSISNSGVRFSKSGWSTCCVNSLISIISGGGSYVCSSRFCCISGLNLSNINFLSLVGLDMDLCWGCCISGSQSLVISCCCHVCALLFWFVNFSSLRCSWLSLLNFFNSWSGKWIDIGFFDLETGRRIIGLKHVWLKFFLLSIGILLSHCLGFGDNIIFVLWYNFNELVLILFLNSLFLLKLMLLFCDHFDLGHCLSLQETFRKRLNVRISFSIYLRISLSIKHSFWLNLRISLNLRAYLCSLAHRNLGAKCSQKHSFGVKRNFCLSISHISKFLINW